jgi:enamine deaminase RidA (YjgF/YER057c/UK114 family)
MGIMNIEARLQELAIELPKVAAPVANFVPYVITGNLVMVSGTLPIERGELVGKGKVGDNITTDEAAAIARVCGINILAVIKKACGGDLSRVKRVVKLGIFVNSTAEFTDQPKVANGVSDLMVEVFGKEIGAHARFAVGAGSLPFGVAVEVDATFEIA